MRLITIVSRYDTLTVNDGEKIDGSRLVWVVRDELYVWVKGPLNGLLYEQAANLALQVCCEMHIPAQMLVRANYSSAVKSRFETKSRRLF